MKRKTHEEYVAELAIKNPDIEVIEQYINRFTAILHYCKKHNVFWKTTPGNVLSGKGCELCKKEKFRKSMCKTHEQYVEELNIKLPHISVIDRYIDKSTPIMHYCSKHDVFWSATPDNVLHHLGCKLCKGEAIGDKLRKTHSEYVEELSIVNPNIEVIGEYIGANIPILHRCKLDQHEWLTTPANMLFGRGCPECKLRLLSRMFVKSHEEYVAQLLISNPDLEVIEQYINAKTPILHKCKRDGHEWRIAPANVLSGQGCPQCQESTNERKIRNWLMAHNIEYEYQQSFADCADKKPLPFDFYIASYNLCIEYDGRQHFEPVDFAGKGKEWALKQLAITQKHDQIKTQYCQDNNINLLRIPYFKNTEDELQLFFDSFNIVT